MMSSASQALAQAGRDQVTAVHRLSWALGISIAIIPILCVGVFFVPLRWRFVREATVLVCEILNHEELLATLRDIDALVKRRGFAETGLK